MVIVGGSDGAIEVNLNDPLVLHCDLPGFTDWSLWKFQRLGKDKEELNVMSKIVTKFSNMGFVLSSKDNLTIERVTKDHAGNYECYDDVEEKIGLKESVQVLG